VPHHKTGRTKTLAIRVTLQSWRKVHLLARKRGLLISELFEQMLALLDENPT
jgi:hypothetical protein